MSKKKRGSRKLRANSVENHSTPSEVALNELEEASKFFGLAEIVYLALDPQGVVLSANHRAASIVGLPLAELIGKNWIDDFIPEEIRSDIQQVMKEIANGRTILDDPYLNPIITPGGRKIHISWKALPIVDKNRKGVGVAAFGDVTPGLKSKKVRFDAILEGVDAGIMLLDPKSAEIIEANKAAHQMLGYDDEPLIGKSASGIFCPTDDHFCNVLNKQKANANHNTTIVSKKGDEIPIARSCKLVEVDGEQYIAISFLDISEQMAMEEKLRSSEQRYEELLANLGEGVGIVDLDENLVYVNDAYAKITGYSRNELIGMNLHDIVPASERSVIAKESKKRKTDRSSVYTVEMKRKDGKRIVTRISAVPQKNESGEIIGTIAVVTNISKRRRAEKAIRIQRDFSSRLGQASSFSQIGDAMVDSCFHLPDVDYAAVYLSKNDSGEFDLISHKCRLLSYRKPPSKLEDPCEEVHSQKNFSSRFFRLEDMGKVASWVNPGGVSSSGIIPIKSDGQVKGCLIVGSADLTKIPSSTQNLLKTLTSIASGVISRIQATQQLQTSEERYRKLIGLLPEGVMIADLNERIQLANPAMAEIFGRQLTEIEGQRFDRLLSVEQRDVLREQTEKRSKGMSSTYDLELKRPDGTVRDVRVSAVPRTNHRGEINGAIGVFVDVTQARKREEELQRLTNELNDRVRQFEVLYMASGLFSDTTEDIEHVIKALLQIISTGFRHSHAASVQVELEGAVFETASFEETPWSLQESIVSSGRKVGSINVCYQEKFPEKDRGPFLDGESTMLAVVATELGQFIIQQRAADEIRTQKERLEAITDSSQDAILSVNPAGKITFWNPAAHQIFGYSQDEAISESFLNLLIPPETHENVRNILEDLMIEGSTSLESPIIEILALRKDGTKFPAEIAVASFSSQGRNGIVITVRDISERKRGQEEKERQRRELELYSSILRHDLLNDLGVVFGYIEAAEMQLDSNSREIQEFFTSAKAALERMESILKVISEPMIGKLDSFVEVIELVTNRAKESSPDVDIIMNIQEQVKGLRIKGGRLVHIIFDNLLRNAIEHAGENTMIEIELKKEGQNLITTVTDTGPGISEQIRDNLFKKGTSTGDGGLGLYLSKKIAEISGGELSLKPSEEERGASFEVVLPLIESHKSAKEYALSLNENRT